MARGKGSLGGSVWFDRVFDTVRLGFQQLEVDKRGLTVLCGVERRGGWINRFEGVSSFEGLSAREFRGLG